MVLVFILLWLVLFTKDASAALMLATQPNSGALSVLLVDGPYPASQRPPNTIPVGSIFNRSKPFSRYHIR